MIGSIIMMEYEEEVELKKDSERIIKCIQKQTRLFNN